MKIPIYQVDAFADALFKGNPAAVCILPHWLECETMQSIAAENNLAETAFLVPLKNDFEIRWFTPEAEVDLCGHATLASAHVLFNHLFFQGDEIQFISKKSGSLFVSRQGDLLQLDFPVDIIKPIQTPEKLAKAFGIEPSASFEGQSDYLLVFENQQQIEAFRPDHPLIAQAGKRGVIVTAKGDRVDFVSRFFAPQIGVPEDPVTGSAHTTLTPYWSSRFGKTNLSAQQLSKRGGSLGCELNGNRVYISGKALTFFEGKIHL